MTIRVWSENRFMPKAIVGSVIYFVVEIALFWDDFAKLGFWPSILRRLTAALLFFVILLAIESYRYARRQRKQQQPE